MKYQQNYTQWVFVWMVCNAKCSFCNAQIPLIWEKDYFSFYSFDRIKNDVQAKVDKWANCIIYEWGDFSLHPEIFQILEFGKSLWIKQTLQTNGIKLSDMEFVKKLKESGVIEMNFSIHAHQEIVSDSIMWVKWFRKTIKWVLNCNKLWMNVSNNLVLVKENLDQLEWMIFLLLKLNVKLFNITMYIPIDGTSIENFHEKFMVNPVDLWIEISKMLKLYKKLMALSGKKLELNLKFHNIWRCIFDKEHHDYDFQFDLDRRKQGGDKYKFDTGFYKKKDCKKCIYNNDCTGFTEKYIKIYWDSYIKPIY